MPSARPEADPLSRPSPASRSKRRALCTLGNDAKDAAARSAAADEYVPRLDALVGKIDRIDATVDRQKRLRFTWNSPLEGLGNTFKLEHLNQELGMAWMFRAACKRQEAVHAVDERPRAPPSCVLARHEEDDDRVVVVGGSVLGAPASSSKPSSAVGNPDGTPDGTSKGTPKSPGPLLGDSAPAVATTLRVAAGLYKHCAERVLPSLHDDLPGERPNELLASMADVMRLVCLAEAQAATARRAEERGTALRLVAKLHLGAWELFTGADKRLNDRVGDFNRISRKLQAYVLLGICTHRARAYRCAAEEAMAETDVGEAIALCDAGMKHLERCATAATESPRWKDAWDEESTAMENLRRKFVTENEVVFFEKVPERPKGNLPEGKVIVAEIEHTPADLVQNLFVE